MNPLHRLADELRQRRLGLRQLIVLDYNGEGCGHHPRHRDKWKRCRLCMAIKRAKRATA